MVTKIPVQPPTVGGGNKIITLLQIFLHPFPPGRGVLSMVPYSTLKTPTQPFQSSTPPFAGAVLDLTTGKLCEIGALLKGSEGANWTFASATKIG